MRLAPGGKCCGRKPLEYKGRVAARQRFCPRCDRSFDFDSGEQRENFAWLHEGGVWRPVSSDAGRAACREQAAAQLTTEDVV